MIGDRVKQRAHGANARSVGKSGANAQGKLRGTSRDEIIDVSRGIIEDEGVEQLTIRRIAQTIHRTQPAAYQHFSGKDATLLEEQGHAFAYADVEFVMRPLPRS